MVNGDIFQNDVLTKSVKLPSSIDSEDACFQKCLCITPCLLPRFNSPINLKNLKFQSLETSCHSSCCQEKEVDGKTYIHIPDSGLDLSSYQCLDHCVYKLKDGSSPSHYCFGKGTSTPTCLKGGCSGSNEVVVGAGSSKGKLEFSDDRSI